MRNLLLVVHIVAVAAWLGASITQMVVAPMLTRRSAEVASAWMSASMNLARRLYPVAGALVLLAGIGLVLVSDVYEFSDLFIGVGFAVVVVGGILGARVFAPLAAKAADAYGAGDVEAGRTASATIARWGLVDVALLIVAIVAMVVRWRL